MLYFDGNYWRDRADLAMITGDAARAGSCELRGWMRRDSKRHKKCSNSRRTEQPNRAFQPSPRQSWWLRKCESAFWEAHLGWPFDGMTSYLFEGAYRTRTIPLVKSMKTAISWILISVVIMLTVACLVVYRKILSLRHSFDIAARSPILLISAGVFSLAVADIVLVHQVQLLEGDGLPCYAMFWSSYACE